MDENLIIFFSAVWLNPPSGPRIADLRIKGINIFVCDTVRRAKGAIFCQVLKIIQLNQDALFITAGNHKCKGAAPSLNKIAINRINEGRKIGVA